MQELRATAGKMESLFGAGPYLVQQQVTAGVELLLGATRDHTFGPVVTVGIGGTLVEVFRDVALRLAPVSEEVAAAMLGELRAQQVYWMDTGAVRQLTGMRLPGLSPVFPGGSMKLSGSNRST